MNAVAGLIASWTHLYATNDAVQLAAAGGHLASIAYALRYAIAGDMAALKLTALSSTARAADGTARMGAGMSARDNAYITTITRAHRHVIAGLACAVAAGLAQLFAQLDYLPRSPIFWTKMFMLALLLGNGRIIQLAGRRIAANSTIAHDRTRLRLAAIRSVALWGAVILLGLMLTTVTPDA